MANLLMKSDVKTSKKEDTMVEKPSEVTHTKSNSNNMGFFKEKQLVLRKSPLTNLFAIEANKGLPNIVYTILFLQFMTTLYREYHGFTTSIHSHHIVVETFGKLDIVLQVWLAMKFVSLVLLYLCFSIWAQNRRTHGKIWDYFWLSFYIMFTIGFLYFPGRSVIINNLPAGSATIVACEQIRLIMKNYAFVRTNAAKIVKQKSEDETNIPNFTTVLYFYFAPTLIYRDEYPRTQEIRWHAVFSYFFQFWAMNFFIFYISESFVINFGNFGKEPTTLAKIFSEFMKTLLTAVFISFSIFYGFFHAWLNMFAELLRFGDREFYQEWWNAEDFSTFYRKWNSFIHGFFYTYMYIDLMKITSSKAITSSIIYIVSAMFHEYLACMAFKFCIPVSSIIVFATGITIQRIPKIPYQRLQGVVAGVAFSFGMAAIWNLYAMEWFARRNCPEYPNPTLDFFIPRVWTCYKIATET